MHVGAFYPNPKGGAGCNRSISLLVIAFMQRRSILTQFPIKISLQFRLPATTENKSKRLNKVEISNPNQDTKNCQPY